MRIVRNIGRSTVSLAILVAAGCAVPAAKPLPAPGIAQGEATLRVQNHHWADVTVYAEVEGVRFRLGAVTSMDSATLPLPRAVRYTAGTVRLILDPIGSTRTFTTEPIAWTTGEGMVFQIENHLALSNLWVVR